MNSLDLSKLTPEIIVIGGLLHLHWRMNRAEFVLDQLAAHFGVKSKPDRKPQRWPLLPLLLAFLVCVFAGCASVSQTLQSRTVAEDGTVEERTLSVRVSAVGDAKQAVEKLRASSGKTLSVGVEGAGQETTSPALADLFLELLRKAAK